MFFTVHDDGTGAKLYAAKPTPAVYYRWENQQWNLLPVTGLPAGYELGDGSLLTLDDGTGPAMYTFLGHSSSASIAARWRNGAWNLMPSAFWHFDPFGDFLPMCSANLGDGMHIYGSVPSGRVGRWNGLSWDIIGQVQGSSQNLFAMIAYDGGHGIGLYVFGQFHFIDGAPAESFAKWDGHSWSNPWPAGTALYSGRPLVTIFDNGDGPKLYSDFAPQINGTGHRGLNRWDGTTWEFLGGPDTSAPEFDGIDAFDDGSGPALYVTGAFSNFAGLPARNMVRYDAQGFHAVPGSDLWTYTQGHGVIRDARGESLIVDATRVSNPPLFYQTVGQLVGCHVPTCAADCNADGRLNVLDFMCFVNAYASFDPYANAQADGFFNVQDFMAFMSRFAAGCP